MVAKLNVPRGADLILTYNFPETVTFTGYDGNFRVYREMNGTVLSNFSTTPSLNGSQVALNGSVITVTMKKEDINSLPADASDSENPSVLFFDLFVTSPSATTSKVHGGAFIVLPYGASITANGTEYEVVFGAQEIEVILEGGTSTGAVRFDVSQGLSDDEAAQARDNIAGASQEDMTIVEADVALRVAVDEPQGFSIAQQLQGQENIGSEEVVNFVTAFGGVGDGVTDNVAAFAAAEASSHKRIYIPPGTFYTSTLFFLISKFYYGDGKIVASSGGNYLPAENRYLRVMPTRGTGFDVNYYFSGDLEAFTRASYEHLAADLRVGLDEPYFESVSTPDFRVFEMNGGYSGESTKLAAPYVSGTSITVDNVTELAIGKTIGFNPSNQLGQPSAYIDRKVISNIVGNMVSWASGDLSQGYPTDTVISTGARTMNSREYRQLTMQGLGDSYISSNRVIIGGPTPSQDDVFKTGTAGHTGSDFVFSTPHKYATGCEYVFVDNNHDVACLAFPIAFNRTNATGARGAFWGMYYCQSYGTASVDFIGSAGGKFMVGYDTTLCNFATNTAINLGVNHLIRWGSTNSGGLNILYGNEPGNTSIGLESDFHWRLRVDDGGTQRIALDAHPEGAITTPRMPIVLAAATSDITLDATFTTYPMGEIYDKTASYNPATGVFTCLVTGDYEIAGHFGIDAASLAGKGFQATIYKNGALAIAGDAILAQAFGPNTADGFTWVLTCAKNDTLEVRIKDGGAAGCVLNGGPITRVSFRLLG